MTERRTRSVRVSDETWSKFVDQVVEWEGKKHGEIGRHVENALKEYIDHGREARIEEKLDEVLAHVSDGSGTHTHTPSTGATSAVEKARDVYQRITRNHDDPVPNADVERAVEDIAGADPRTIEKYKGILKKRCLLFEHPTSAVWATNRDEWVGWCESYIDNDPTADVREVTSSYGMTIDEYEIVVEQQLAEVA